MMQRMISSLKTLFRMDTIVFPDKKVLENKEDFDVSQMYTTLSEAKEEIWRRWNDKELRKKVEKYLGGVPELFAKEPKAGLFRFIATPNFEFRRFFDLATGIGLKSVYIEFLNDKFCTRNKDKVHLGKLCFSDGVNLSGTCIDKIFDFEKYENKSFSKILTKEGENLVEFHHNMMKDSGFDIEIFDVSEFKRNGESAKEVYCKFLALFVCYGVLFENYIVKDRSYEQKFIKDVVYPAFEIVQKKFGVKPIIVPLLPIREEESSEWMWYPTKIKNKILN